MQRGLFAGGKKSLAGVVCAAVLAAAAWGGVWAQTIVVKNDADGWDGLKLTLISEGKNCGPGAVLHRAVGTGSGNYVFSAVVDGEYTLCVNNEISVDVSISDEGTKITPDVLEFKSE